MNKRLKGRNFYTQIAAQKPENIANVLAKLTEEEQIFILNVHGGDLNKERIILSKEDTKKYYDLVYKIGRNLGREVKESVVTTDALSDFIHKLNYTPLSRKEEKSLIKKAQLSFYHEVDDETKETYIKQYMEEFPDINEKYQKANKEEKQIILSAAIEDSYYWRDKFIENNQRLVVVCAKKYKSESLSVMELIHEGNEGIIIALRKFDANQGNKFSTYAVNWIRKVISRAIDDQDSTIRIPVNISEKYRKINRIEIELSGKLQRIPTIKEIASEVGLKEKKVLSVKREVESKAHPTSLEILVGDKQEKTLGEILPSNEPDFTEIIETKFENIELREIIEKTILNQRDIEILYMRFGLKDDNPKSLEEIGIIYDITKERARQIEQNILIKLRKELTHKKMEPFIKKTETPKPISKTKQLLPPFQLSSLYKHLIISKEDKGIIEETIKTKKLEKEIRK